MATKRQCTVLSIEDKITICECLDRGSFKREITHEYDMASWLFQNSSCNCFYLFVLIIRTFWLSEQVLVLRMSDNRGSTVDSFIKMWRYFSFESYALSFLIIPYCSVCSHGKGDFNWHQQYTAWGAIDAIHHEQAISGKEMHPLITFMVIALWLLIIIVDSL